MHLVWSSIFFKLNIQVTEIKGNMVSSTSVRILVNVIGGRGKGCSHICLNRGTHFTLIGMVETIVASKSHMAWFGTNLTDWARSITKRCGGGGGERRVTTALTSTSIGAA
jgi:hypothetical protein